MKQAILTSKISFKLYKKKIKSNRKITPYQPADSQCATDLNSCQPVSYLKTALEHIHWHQTTEMQHFLHIKVSRQKDTTAYSKGMLGVKRSKQKRYRLCTMVHSVQAAVKHLDLRGSYRVPSTHPADGSS